MRNMFGVVGGARWSLDLLSWTPDEHVGIVATDSTYVSRLAAVIPVGPHRNVCVCVCVCV
jgi:hypothetical protein